MTYIMVQYRSYLLEVYASQAWFRIVTCCSISEVGEGELLASRSPLPARVIAPPALTPRRQHRFEAES